MSEILITIASKIGGILVKPTIRHVCYLLDFERNVKDLETAKGHLRLKQEEVERDVKKAQQNDKQIPEYVMKWLTDVEKILKDVEELESEIKLKETCFYGWCPNWSWRYRLGKEATMKKDEMDKLRKESPDRVSYQATFPGMEFFSSKDFMPFETTTSAFKQIMEALNDENNNMIGLYGTGGVGKTTLAKRVGQMAKKEGLVDVVAMAVVSQTPDLRKIQNEIAAFLDLKFEKTTEIERKFELQTRLKNEKRILIILDDVWENLKRTCDIGIPYGDDHKGCKILLTTRNLALCDCMDSKKNIPLGVLSETEAWDLFEKIAGLDNNFPSLNVAMKVAKKCKGLPLAIVAVGTALKGKTRVEYEQAFEQLDKFKKFKFVNKKVVGIDIYKCLKLSYSYLKDKETKLCFLLCSLFPEDYEINIEDLVRCGINLCEDSDSIEDARRQLLVIINDLKSSSLLLEASGVRDSRYWDPTHRDDNLLPDSLKQQFVKMHDVVRYVASLIASEEKENELKVEAYVRPEWPKERSVQYTSISLLAKGIKVLPSKVECPRLEILLLRGGYSFIDDHFYRFSERMKGLEKNSLIVPDNFFEGMKALKVLTLSNGSLGPQSLELLTNLQMLQLEYCKFSDISSLGKLKRLKVLSFCGSPMEELPNEVGELNNLRLLDLTNCRLKRIPPDVIRQLLLLEELYMMGRKAFKGWGIEGSSVERSNASISELKELSKLAVLSMNLTPQCLPQDFSFHNLHGYDIWLTKSVDYPNFPLFFFSRGTVDYPSSRKLVFESIDASSEINAFKKLFQTVELLELEHTYGCQNIIPNMEKGGLNALISLGLISCNEMECLIDSTQQQVPPTVFSNLEQLSLAQMTHLREICNGDQPPTEFLQKLKTLWVRNCSNMPSVFPEKLLQRLQNLEEVTIKSCDEVQEVFGLERPTHHVVEGTHVMLLSNLTSLHLDELPKLRCIWKGPTQHVILQRLIDVEVLNCKRLAFLFSSSLAQSLVQLRRLKIADCEGLEQIIIIEMEDGEILTQAHVQPLRFSKLTTLVITNCEKLEYIFPISIARSLRQLEDLQILNCPQLKQVFSHEKEEDVFVGDGNDIELPKLRIELRGLSSLTSFSKGNYHWMWPSLQKLIVEECPKLQALEKQLRVLRLQNLELLIIKNCEGVEEVFHGILSVSKLESLTLEDLPELRVIWKGSTQISSFQNLTRICVTNCNKLTHLFSPRLASNLPRLEFLRIKRCEELERIIDEEDKDEEDQIIGFPNLKVIHVLDCNKLKSLFPITIAQGLPQLKEIYVIRVSQLEEVFSHENEEYVKDEKKIVLCQLQNLYLEKLSRLIGFCQGGYHFIFPSLKQLIVRDCHKITTSFTIALDDKTVHTKDKAKKEKSYVVDESHEDVEGAEVKVEEEEEELEEDKIIESHIELEGEIVEPDKALPHKRLKIFTNSAILTPQLVEEDLPEWSSTTHTTVATRPSGSDIQWFRSDPITLPPYIEESLGNL